MNMAGPAEEELGKWEQKVQEAVEQDGGLTRNSMPEAIAAARDAYDQFLARYPLLFGYWHRFAKQEFAVAGTEAAELVSEKRERAIGRHALMLPNTGIRARRCEHPHLRRPLDELLRLQDRHQSRPRRDTRVSCRAIPFPLPCLLRQHALCDSQVTIHVVRDPARKTAALRFSRLLIRLSLSPSHTHGVPRLPRAFGIVLTA